MPAELVADVLQGRASRIELDGNSYLRCGHALPSDGRALIAEELQYGALAQLVAGRELSGWSAAAVVVNKLCDCARVEPLDGLVHVRRPFGPA